MARAWRAAWIGLWVLAGCVAGPPQRQVAARRAALGTPQDGFPNWNERTIYVLTNRARCDPAADLADCPESRCGEKACYEPVPPLAWHHALARAARFQAALLTDVCGGSLQHDSPCDLVADIGDTFEPGPCDGSASCACEPGTARCGYRGTSPSERVRGRFRAPYQGENLAGGAGDPRATFYLWFHERSPDPGCAFSLSNGHRWNILNGRHGAIGVGVSGRVAAQDFGAGRPPQGLVAGTHYPRRGATITFWANWYASAAPAEAVVNVGGDCRTMALERGSETNGTYAVQLSGVGSGCTPYRFEFRAADGTEHLVPDTGAYGIGCAEDWLPDPPPRCGCTPACSGRECGDDGCGGSCGRCAAGSRCVAGRCEAAAPPDAGSGGDGGSGGGDTGTGGDGGAGRPDGGGGDVGARDAGDDGGTVVIDRGGAEGEVARLRPGCACGIAHAGDGPERRGSLLLALLPAAAIASRRRRPGR